jgi:geranylgeranyl reductase family protein
MDACDALIVGAGPGGSTCARMLERAGLDCVILDKSTFPRDKVCGGWITPAVLEEIELDSTAYASHRVFQPITGFRTSRMGDVEIETDYGKPISYGIRRFEFDDYLLGRCGARIRGESPMKTLERSGSGWVVNGQIKTRLVIGAGGHFCPVARWMGADARAEVAVAAQEAEFEMTPRQRDACAVRGEVPELFFCADMKGYGWCFRKGNFLNVGLGRLDPRALPSHVAQFMQFLKRAGKLGFDLPASMLGHAYLLYGRTKRKIIGDGILLIGDAAGLAYSQSGEGIRPAIESGLLAAKAILEAYGDYRREKLEVYQSLLASRFGDSDAGWTTAIGRRLPTPLVSTLARALLATRWFPRHVVLDRWFLHCNQPALISGIGEPVKIEESVA